MNKETYFKKFECNPELTQDEINRISLPQNFPLDYFELIRFCNGGEGFIGEEYVVLFQLEDLIQINKDYEVAEHTPGIFLFGSNGAGEALAFDLRTNNIKYILIPFVFEYEAIIELGENLDEFLERVYTKGYFE